MDAKLIRLRSPSPRARALAAADGAMSRAKAAFSCTAIACLAGRDDAEEQMHAALLLVEKGRADLARIADQELDVLPTATKRLREPAID